MPVQQRNAAADRRQMRRIISEDPGWSLALVPTLTDLCITHIAHNFQHNPILEDLLPEHRKKVVERLSSALPLRVSAALVPQEEYWRRRCCELWRVCDVSRYGCSWKRMFFERHLENLIERFLPEQTDPAPIRELAELGRHHIRKLQVQELLPPLRSHRREEEEEEPPSPDHFDLNLIAPSLAALEELHLVYGVKGCGMNFEWKLFRFTGRDCSLLADALKTLRKLQVFSLQRSRVDDEKIRVLVRNLLDHPSLVQLDLSHNLISERGARAIGKLLNQSQLQILNLCNNKIRSPGARAIACALSKNSSLHTLNLRLNHLGDQGGQALCNALLQNTTLRALHLGSNQLSAPTANALSHVLSQNSSLQSIGLSCNHIGPDGGRQLLDGVSVNGAMLDLDLRVTDVGQETEFLINKVLRRNQERFRVHQPETPPPEQHLAPPV